MDSKTPSIVDEPEIDQTEIGKTEMYQLDTNEPELDEPELNEPEIGQQEMFESKWSQSEINESVDESNQLEVWTSHHHSSTEIPQESSTEQQGNYLVKH